MYLLNRAQIKAEMKSGALQIGAFNRQRLHHTFYYVALGRDIERQDPKTGKWRPEQLSEGQQLTIDAGACVRVKSFETFALKECVVGMLGSTSRLSLDGVALLHGSSIDPMYPPPDAGGQVLSAPLEMALVNHGLRAVKIPWGDQPIAKISFFDSSDTYPIKPRKDWLKQARG
jgi:hypothetical protein